MGGSHGIEKVPGWPDSQNVLPGLWVPRLMTLLGGRLGNPLVLWRGGRQLEISSQFYMWSLED